MKRIVLIFGSALVGCQPPAAPGPALPDATPQRVTLGINYADWPTATATPYPVAPAFLMMCAPPNAEQLQQREAEKNERGPHAESAIVVRVNPAGLDRFKSGQSVPVGTVVVKEKYPQYSPDAPPVAVAAMIKREPGYDPDHGDWEYAYEHLWPEQGRKVVRGKIVSCIECHQGAREKDYLFRPYLRAPR